MLFCVTKRERSKRIIKIGDYLRLNVKICVSVIQSNNDKKKILCVFFFLMLFSSFTHLFMNDEINISSIGHLCIYSLVVYVVDGDKKKIVIVFFLLLT